MEQAAPVLKVKVKRIHSDAILPKYQSHGAACFDIHTVQGGEVGPGCSRIFATGLKFEIPDGYVMLVYSRSGHGFNSDVRLSNCTGVIDADFRGELKVKLKADGPFRLDVNIGDRIAQAMIIAKPAVEFEESNELSETVRGEGGLGSTGQ